MDRFLRHVEMPPFKLEYSRAPAWMQPGAIGGLAIGFEHPTVRSMREDIPSTGIDKSDGIDENEQISFKDPPL